MRASEIKRSILSDYLSQRLFALCTWQAIWSQKPKERGPKCFHICCRSPALWRLFVAIFFQCALLGGHLHPSAARTLLPHLQRL